MNIYRRKQIWKISLLLLAVAVAAGSLFYTNRLVEKLATEERKKIELWAEATRELITSTDQDSDFSFVLKVIQDNETVPVIVTDENDTILYHRNLHEKRVDDELYLSRQLERMKSQNEPIELVISEDTRQFIYYGDSFLLIQLFYYPILQLGIIILFIMVAYIAFSNSRKAEQNQVWLGMSRETAHQLGTPTSSLLALVELLKSQDADPQTVVELEKDVRRLEKITDRFSNVGSKPFLEHTNLTEVVGQGVDYIRKRASREVQIEFKAPRRKVFVPLNASLFDWVIENLCKNAADSLEGSGRIDVQIREVRQEVAIDVSDNGKGIPRSLFQTIFKPGFTTKSRGWGLGLSLSKRIIEMYHGGKIFVLRSEPGVKTTIRILLKRKAGRTGRLSIKK